MDESVAIGPAAIRLDGDDAPPVLAPANTACAQSSVASTTAQPYPVDCITNRQSWKDEGSCQGARGSCGGFI